VKEKIGLDILESPPNSPISIRTPAPKSPRPIMARMGAANPRVCRIRSIIENGLTFR